MGGTTRTLIGQIAGFHVDGYHEPCCAFEFEGFVADLPGLDLVWHHFEAVILGCTEIGDVLEHSGLSCKGLLVPEELNTLAKQLNINLISQ